MDHKTLTWCLFVLVASHVTDILAAELSPAGPYVITKVSVTDLGTLGGEESVALDINNAGEIVGWSKTSQGYTHAFLFRNGSMEDLVATGVPIKNSEAHGINNKTQVVGFFRDNFPPPDDFPHAFFLNKPGEPFTPLPEVFSPEKAEHCKYVGMARAINDSGVTVGYTWFGKDLTPKPPGCSIGMEEAVRWAPPAFTPHGLIGTFHPDRALDINNQGQIIGYTQNTDNYFDSYFLWDGDPFKSLVAYADFDPPTFYRSFGIEQVAGINDYGRAVVNGYLPGTGAKKHALFWKKSDAVALDLGTFPGGKESVGYEINNQNMIAGTADRPPRQQTGSLPVKQIVVFLWHQHFGMRALPKLPNASPSKCEAYSLNDRAASPPRLVPGGGLLYRRQQASRRALGRDHQQTGIDSSRATYIDLRSPADQILDGE